MSFEEVYGDWQGKRLTQEQAARILGVCERSFRRYVERYEGEGLEGLLDRRIEKESSRRAPLDEVMRVVDLYRKRHDGWNVKHFHAWYRKDQAGTRSYSWVKNVLQQASAVQRTKGKGNFAPGVPLAAGSSPSAALLSAWATGSSGVPLSRPPSTHPPRRFLSYLNWQ